MPQPYIRQYHIPGVCPVCGRDARGLTIVYVGVQNEALVFRLFYEHFNTICCDTAKSEIGSEQWTAVYSPDIASVRLFDRRLCVLGFVVGGLVGGATSC